MLLNVVVTVAVFLFAWIGAAYVGRYRADGHARLKDAVFDIFRLPESLVAGAGVLLAIVAVLALIAGVVYAVAYVAGLGWAAASHR